MSASTRKVAAQHFRQHSKRSNALHAQYLGNPQLLRNYDRFANWQLDYLLPLFADLYDRPGYAEAIDFPMSDLAGTGISERDRDLERAAPAITSMLSLKALATISAAAEMIQAEMLVASGTAVSTCRKLWARWLKAIRPRPTSAQD